MLDELDRIEAKIARLRKLMYANQSDLLLGSDLHREIDQLVARHARISMNRYRARISPPGTKTWR